MREESVFVRLLVAGIKSLCGTGCGSGRKVIGKTRGTRGALLEHARAACRRSWQNTDRRQLGSIFRRFPLFLWNPLDLVENE